MKYITSKEASALMGKTLRRVQQMCKTGIIPNAIKKDRSWLIPEDSLPLENNLSEK